MPVTPALVISGYTEEASGTGPGLVRFALDGGGGVGERLAQTAEVHNPSFVVAEAGVLLAVEELAQGNVLALDPTTLEVLARTASGGADPCHVALVGETVWAAHYSSGTAAALDLPALLAGTPGLEPRLVAHAGPASSHAHQVSATRWGSVLVADLGADSVDEYDAQSHALLGSARLPQGAGPRHVALKGDHLFVAGELDGHLHVFVRESREQAHHGWRWLFKVPLAHSAAQPAGDFYPSHIELSPDADKLYAAVRGPNTLLVLDVSGLSGDAAGQALEPRVLQEIPCGGNWPRHFALTGEKIYVANQRSNNVAVFDLAGDGLITADRTQSVDFGSPTCVVVL